MLLVHFRRRVRSYTPGASLPDCDARNLPMKIAFRITVMGFGGAEQVFLSLAREFSRQFGWSADFVVDAGRGESLQTVRDHGFGVVDLQAARTMASIKPLRRYLDAHRPDLLISAYPHTNAAAVLSCQWAKHRPRLVLSEHMSIADPSFTRTTQWSLEFITRTFYRHADHIVTVSGGIREQLLTRLPHMSGRITTIHNPSRFPPAPLTSTTTRPKVVGPKTILAVGRICVQKDYATLLRAFHGIRDQTDARLLILGGVFETDVNLQLQQYVQEHQLGDRVTFGGFTQNVQEHYARADVFVLSSACEGFGNVLVEALSFGLPVVSTDCPFGPTEILDGGHYGRLTPVGNDVALGQALLAALRDETHDPAQSRARAATFTEAVIAQRYADLFQSICHAT